MWSFAMQIKTSSSKDDAHWLHIKVANYRKAYSTYEQTNSSKVAIQATFLRSLIVIRLITDLVEQTHR